MRPACDHLGDALAAFEALASAATPAPWHISACSDEGTLFEVRSAGALVESGLPRAFARYVCFLRAASAQLLEADRRGTKLTKRQKADLLDEANALMREVRAQWVFVAPNTQDARYYLHDCVRQIGAGTLSRADALFIDEAKHFVLRLRPGVASPEHQLGEGRRTLVIPRRAAARVDVAAEYRAFADTEGPLHALSGRHEMVGRTGAILNAIRAHMDFAASHRVLDIGCGDASLLRSLAPTIAGGVGTVLTTRERDKLASEPTLQGLDFAAASFSDLSFLQGPFDRVVANGCIHFARTRMAAERALRSIAALMPVKGKLWVGELHARDSGRVVFSSKRAALRYVRTLYGNRFALAFLRHLWRRRRRADLIAAPAAIDYWYVKPQVFVALADRCGFEVEGLWTCRDLTGDTFYSLQERFSCLLIKR